MGILHDELVRVIHELWTDGPMMRELLRHVLRKHGLTLSDPEIESLAQSIEAGVDSVEVPIDGPEQTILISPDMIDQAFQDLEEKIETDTERAITSVVDEIAPSILGSLYAALPEALRGWHAAQRAFERRLRGRWKAGLDRLDMLITMAQESGETYLEDYQSELNETDPSDEAVLMNVLTALHCRACRTSREVVCLLKAGYADGAQARWRSLHELAVTSFFLLQHPSDTPQRYLDHAAVERWRAAKQYQQHCDTLGYEPFSTDELNELEEALETAIHKHGTPFKEDYGWAARALEVPRPTFTQIEASLDMSHWRPFFKLACQSVHAGSQGLFFSLGLPRDSRTMLLAGPSDAGLADPGHQMAISLTMVTVAFLTSRPNLDGLVACHCLLALCDDIGKELLRAHDETLEIEDGSPDES